MSTLQKKQNQDREANKDMLQQGSSDWFKFQEGVNNIRVLVEPEFLAELFKVGICYTGCGYKGTPKYLTWVLDKADGKVKLFKMPMTIFDQLADLQLSARFMFDRFPMPYDLEVKVKNAGTKEVTYTIIPGAEYPVTTDVLTTLAEQNSPAEIIQSMKDKQKEKVEKGEVKLPKKEELPTVQIKEDDGSVDEDALKDIPF